MIADNTTITNASLVPTQTVTLTYSQVPYAGQETAKELVQPQHSASHLKRKREGGSYNDNTNLPGDTGISTKERGRLIQNLNRSQTMYSHRRFEQRNYFLPRAMFIGLCSLLYTLHKWQWFKDDTRLDDFIMLYTTYLQEHSSTKSPCLSYHHWIMKQFEKKREEPEARADESVLTLDVLNSIAMENPYSVFQMECTIQHASVEHLAKKLEERLNL